MISYCTSTDNTIHPRLSILFNALNYKIFPCPIWDKVEDAVVQTVISQMLSKDASNSILNGLYQNKGNADNILKWCSKSANRKGPVYGVSQKKRKALKVFHKLVSDNGNIAHNWGSLTHHDLHKEITSIWGLGTWSADMLSIFYLGNKNVWPQTDTGIRNISKLFFNTDNFEEIKEYLVGNETYVALCFWEVINERLANTLKIMWTT